MKTLHPGVHAGILAKRDDDAHVAQIAQHGIEPIDLVVVNLYPFEQVCTLIRRRFTSSLELQIF